MSPGRSTSPTRERLRANVRPRGEGGGAAREGAALLQGLLRCGRCGRRMQVAYSGTRRPRRRAMRACAGRHLHGTEPDLPDARRRAAGQGRRRGVPRGGHPGRRRRASAGAIGELEDQHEARLAGQRLALERAEFEAERAERQFDACEPENRLVARTLERKLEDALAARRARAAASWPRSSTPGPRRSPTPSAKRWRASRATSRGCGRPRHDHRPRPQGTAAHADPRGRRHGQPPRSTAPTSRSSGRAARAPSCGVQLNPPRARTPPHRRGHDRADPPARRASPRPPDRRDPQPARPAHRDRAAVHRGARPSAARQRAGIPAAPPPDPNSELVTIQQAPPRELGVSTATDPPLAAARPAPRRANHRRRAVADPAHRRGPRPVRARHPRRVRRARRGRAPARRRAPDRVAQGPTRRAASAIQVTNGRRKGLQNRGSATPTLDCLITR